MSVKPTFIYQPVSFEGVSSVTDKSTFRPDSEMVRALKFNPAGGMQGNPQYDYADGKVPEKDPVSPEIIALRSGKLDKADAEALKRRILESAKSDMDDEHLQKIKDAMDRVLGISDSEESKKD